MLLAEDIESQLAASKPQTCEGTHTRAEESPTYLPGDWAMKQTHVVENCGSLLCSMTVTILSNSHLQITIFFPVHSILLPPCSMTLPPWQIPSIDESRFSAFSIPIPLWLNNSGGNHKTTHVWLLENDDIPPQLFFHTAQQTTLSRVPGEILPPCFSGATSNCPGILQAPNSFTISFILK